MVVSGHPTRETIMGPAFALEILAGEPWLPTPLLPAQVIGSRLGTELWLTREDCSPVGSFKLWGGMGRSWDESAPIHDRGRAGRAGADKGHCGGAKEPGGRGLAGARGRSRCCRRSGA